jgi:hypothetical protein
MIQGMELYEKDAILFIILAFERTASCFLEVRGYVTLELPKVLHPKSNNSQKQKNIQGRVFDRRVLGRFEG